MVAPAQGRPRSRLVTVLVLALIALTAVYLFSQYIERSPPYVGRPAPDVPLNALRDGRRVSLSDFAGRVVVLDFWSTSCGACVEALPELEAVYRAYRGRGAEVLGINLEPGIEPSVRAFVRSRGLTYPMYVDATGEARSRYKVRSIPFLVVIGADGIVRWTHRGPADADTIGAEVERAFAPAEPRAGTPGP
jgi:peroxiredoxin